VIAPDWKGRFGFHNFRHSLATALVKLKVDAKTVQGVLRHEDFGTTIQLYAQSDMEAMRDAQGKFLEQLWATESTCSPSKFTENHGWNRGWKVSPLVGGQEHRCRRNVFGLPHEPYRNHRPKAFLHRIRVLAKLTFKNRRLGRAR
jgi:hypothetical protein